MKVQIESIPQAFNTPSLNYEMYDIIGKAFESKDLDELREKLNNESYSEFEIGFGADHCWVHQIDFRTGETIKTRLLLIQ